MEEKRCIYGNITRSLSSTWCNAGGCVDSIPSAQTLLVSMGIFPSKAQVCEMLHVARECGDSTTTKPSLLTFGEFCLFSTELSRDYHPEKKVPRTPLYRQISAHNHTDSPNKIKTVPPKACEVFLGGSCNPTTWRQDTAIPLLKELGISYYNPQVTHWEEALVEKEHIAKTTASVLFFVFDRRTRNVASMVEVAYIAASKRKIMLVLDSYPGPDHVIGGEPMSKDEYEELSGGLNTVQDLVERKGIPVFSQIPHALHCTAKIINEDLWPQQLGVADNVTPVKNPCLTPTENFNKIHTAFRGCSLSLADAQNVFVDVVGRPMTHDELITVVTAKKGGSVSVSSELPLKEIFVNVEEFCCIVAEFSSPRLEKRTMRNNIFSNSLVTAFQKTFGVNKDSLRGSHLLSPPKSDSLNHHSSPSNNFTHPILSKVSEKYSIYLGGAVHSSQTWQSKIALPLLNQENISYCLPSHYPKVNGVKLTNGDSNHLNGGERESRGRLYPSEAHNIDQCRVLLFVITSNTRGVSTMALASHYIGLGCNVVLCVQRIEDSGVVNGEQLTKAAIKDYNRGRSYLTDQAEKDGVPVFSDISEALACAVHKSKLHR